MTPESDPTGSRVERVPKVCETCGATFSGTRIIIRAQDPETQGWSERASEFGRFCAVCSRTMDNGTQSAKQKAFVASREKEWLVACPEGYRTEWILEQIRKPSENPPKPAGKHWPKVKQVIDAVKAGKGCCLFGPSGSFKTTAIYHGAIKRFVWEGKNFLARAVFEWRGEMLREAREGDIAKAVMRYARVPWLFLDDLGNMAGTPSSEEALHYLLEMRMRYQKPLLVTTQFTGEELVEKFKNKEQGAAVIRRLALLAGTPIKCKV